MSLSISFLSFSFLGTLRLRADLLVRWKVKGTKSTVSWRENAVVQGVRVSNISLFDNVTVRFALPLYLLNLTGCSALYGTVTACAFIPAILLLLPSVLINYLNDSMPLYHHGMLNHNYRADNVLYLSRSSTALAVKGDRRYSHRFHVHTAIKQRIIRSPV